MAVFKPLVLIVDDQEQNLKLIEAILQTQGYSVLLARGGHQALSIFEKTRVDLVLLDVVMPDMDGIEVLKLIKSDSTMRDIPVVMISGFHDMAKIAQSLELGADDYLLKPVENTLLRARVKSSLEKRRLQDQERVFVSKLRDANLRQENLLRSIFPHIVVEELLSTNTVVPRRFHSVSVLFADIVGFTTYCEENDPQIVLNHLQELFERFEQIANDHKLDKIKTIGDAFMASAGMLTPLENPVLESVRCGLQMLVVAPQLPPHWEVRIGIHVGEVIAGVVGKNRFNYDIWGDTVNTAARVQSYGVANAVNVSGEAWQFISNEFRGRSMGFLEIKGKGTMEIVAITPQANQSRVGASS